MAIAIGKDLKMELESFSVWNAAEKGFRAESVNTNVNPGEFEIDLTVRSIGAGIIVNLIFPIGSQASIYLKEKLGNGIVSGVLLDMDTVIPADVIKYVAENSASLGCKCNITIQQPVQRESIDFPRPTLFGEPIEFPKVTSFDLAKKGSEKTIATIFSSEKNKEKKKLSVVEEMKMISDNLVNSASQAGISVEELARAMMALNGAGVIGNLKGEELAKRSAPFKNPIPRKKKELIMNAIPKKPIGKRRIRIE